MRVSLHNVREILTNLRNFLYRRRLKNRDVSILCSNCTGGFIYHWLGLKFKSPFINLRMTNEDFLTAMENLSDFLNTDLIEDKSGEFDCPCGIGYKNVRVIFVHYNSWDDAITKWEERKKRINFDNLLILFGDINPDDETGCQMELIKRFEKLPFKNKIVFTDNPYSDFNSVVYLPKWTRNLEGVFQPVSKISGKKPIDDFDFVGYINSINP